MNCLIIDDEPLAHKVIKNHCSKLPFLSIVKECYSAFEAISFLNENTTDLIFLDINMPELKGLDFLRTLTNSPLTIITSAYTEFALESYELNIIDYLVKPFSFERFLTAVNKAQAQKKLLSLAENDLKQGNLAESFNKYKTPETIFIKGNKMLHQVNLKDINYLEANGSYVKIFCENEVIMTFARLLKFEESLPKEKFIRVHRSFIVAISKIQNIEGNRMKLSKTYIPIGKVFKHNLNRIIK